MSFGTCLNGLAAFIILLIGIALTAITIYGYTNTQIFIDDTSSVYTILNIMISADFLIIVIAILGMCALKKASTCLIVIFQIFLFIFFVVFLGLAIGAYQLPKQFRIEDCSISDNPTLQLAYNVNSKATNLFCINQGCTCSLSDQSINNYDSTDSQFLINTYQNRNSNGVNVFQSCLLNSTDTSKDEFNLEELTQDEKKMGEIIGIIEQMFSCSGWCEDSRNNLIYRFSGVNLGKPANNYCFNMLSDQINQYGHLLGTTALIAASFFFLLTLINCCICCCAGSTGQRPYKRLYSGLGTKWDLDNHSNQLNPNNWRFLSSRRHN